MEEVHELGNHLEDALREDGLVLAYGLAGIIGEKLIRRYHFEYHMQAIRLALQMRYLKDSMKKKLSCFNIPTHIIDIKIFGKMDGKQVLQDILNAMIRYLSIRREKELLSIRLISVQQGAEIKG